MTDQRRELVRRNCLEVLEGQAERLAPLRKGHVFITGGTGFMGTWLAELLTCLNDQYAFGMRVALLSRQAQSLRESAPHLAARKDVALVEKDARELAELPESTSWLIHAAASPDNRTHSSDPLETIDSIVGGTRAVMEAAARLPELKRVLNVGSGLSCGAQPLDWPGLPEHFAGHLDFSSAGACYAEAKRLAETLCAAFRNEHRMEIVTARPFAFLGPYQLLSRPWAVNNFVRDGLLGGPIRIQGDGETVRSYMYPSDMAFWLLRILVDGKNGGVYNVGSPDGIKLKDLAVKIADSFSKRPKIEFGVLKGGAPNTSRLVPDVSSARTALGLGLRTGLDTAIEYTLAWHRNAAPGKIASTI